MINHRNFEHCALCRWVFVAWLALSVIVALVLFPWWASLSIAAFYGFMAWVEHRRATLSIERLPEMLAFRRAQSEQRMANRTQKPVDNPRQR